MLDLGKNHISVEVEDENMWTSFSLTADGALIKLRNCVKFRLLKPSYCFPRKMMTLKHFILKRMV